MSVPLHRDLAGNIIPRGRTVKTLVEPFVNASALPAWLRSTGSGSITYTGETAAAFASRVNINAGAVDLQTHQIDTPFTIATQAMREIRWEIDGYGVSTNNHCLPFIGIDGTDCGILLNLAAEGENVGYLRVKYPTGQTDSTDAHVRLTSPRPRNIGLILRPRDKTAFVIQDDQVLHAVHNVNIVSSSSVVRPKVGITNGTATNISLWAKQIRLTLVSA